MGVIQNAINQVLYHSANYKVQKERYRFYKSKASLNETKMPKKPRGAKLQTMRNRAFESATGEANARTIQRSAFKEALNNKFGGMY